MVSGLGRLLATHGEIPHPSCRFVENCYRGIHAALAYFYDYRDEIRKDMAADAELVDSLKRTIPSKMAAKLNRRDA
jgi:hypothetical protein